MQQTDGECCNLPAMQPASGPSSVFLIYINTNVCIYNQVYIVLCITRMEADYSASGKADGKLGLLKYNLLEE